MLPELPRGRREQTIDPKRHKMIKNVKIHEFGDYVRNNHKKCIQISTNMSSISSLICEIDVNISEMWESTKVFLSKTIARILNVKENIQ